MEKLNLHSLSSVPLLLLVGWLTTTYLASSQTSITSDQTALLALKARVTLEPQGVLTHNWSVGTSTCSWVGVTCGVSHLRVTALNISYMGLGGSLPSQLGNLSFLNSLDISGNNFGGYLPDELGNLQRLKFLNLKSNNFNGSLPPQLHALSQLEHLLLADNSFTGSIPPTIFNISSLERIDLSNNGLTGNLPSDICYHLPKLQTLNLSFNDLDGRFPSTLYKCSQLQILRLDVNYFNGPIPREICNSTTLKSLFIGANYLKGEIPKEIDNLASLEMLNIGQAGLVGSIPPSIFNITSLKLIDFGNNSLTGGIPQQIALLPNLERLVLHFNGLRGPIPARVFNLSTLRVISFVANQLSGNLPSTIGHSLSNLRGLYLADNNLTGTISHSISNASKLTYLELSSNKFSGSIPNSLCNLGLLEVLNLAQNDFSSESSAPELGFLTCLTNCRYLRKLFVGENRLNSSLSASTGNLSTSLDTFDTNNCGIKGNIPSGIGNLSNLVSLYLNGNDLTGSIPTTIGGLGRLQRLHLESNMIQGSMPTGLCHLMNLGELALSENMFSGSIPACLGNVTSLRYLYLGSNRLTSSIPTTLWSLKDLLELNLSSNSLSGYPLPQLGSLKVATSVDLSMNLFTGYIPSTVGGLQNLINLSLAHNRLQGTIPESFGSLVNLQFLDLSHNNLSGAIPISLEKLSYLKYLNLSFNTLRGEIPSGGPFTNFSGYSFMWNEALCGAPQFSVLPCDTSSDHKSRRRRRILLVIYILLPILLVLTSACVFLRCRKRNQIPIQRDFLPAITHRRITYQELLVATDGFTECNLLGMGSFGSVYRGTLMDGAIVAVKIFNLHLESAFKSFDRECEIVRNIRHRNLTKIISSCSTPDFKALILEYMPNGSLENWLYSHNYFLDILQRLNIMIDVACALEYLHHGYSMPIVHCDLKPSNVLLDEDMVAHVSDFGIARFLDEGESSALTTTLATFGYIAPEYGLEGLVTTRCDVYSYGIMLMETFTRRKPTDEIFVGGLISLKSWVSESLPNAPIQVIDSNLLRPEEDDFTAKMQCVSSIMEVALKCSAESPQERISINDALAALRKIKFHFFASH